MTRSTTLACLLLALSGGVARAELAPAEEAELYRRILRHDRTLADPDKAQVAVLAPPGDARAAALAAAFAEKGLPARVVTEAELPGASPQVLYVRPGADTALPRALAEARHLLTICASPELVERGALSVAVREVEGGRREVLVNTTRAYYEGHALDPALLAAARVYRSVAPAPQAEVVDRLPDDQARPARLAGELPVYTREALSARAEGTVSARCAISAEGRVGSCVVLKGVPFMDQAVVDALETWRVTPVVREGRPLAVRAHTFQVRLALPQR